MSLVDDAVYRDGDDLPIGAVREVFLQVLGGIEHVRDLAELLVGALLVVVRLGSHLWLARVVPVVRFILKPISLLCCGVSWRGALKSPP